MKLRSIRDFVIGKVKQVASSDVVVYADGDVSKPDVLQVRARVKVLPAETTKIGVGINGYKQGEGLVVIDTFSSKVAGERDKLEDFATDIVDSFQFITQPLDDGNTIHIWTAWVDQTIDETTQFHIPVFVRWTLIHS